LAIEGRKLNRETTTAMTAWIIVVALVLLLFVQNRRILRQKMYMADYIIVMFADEQQYHDYRQGFLAVVKSWDGKYQGMTLWLQSNTTLTRFIPTWGKRHGSPAVAEAALKEWLTTEGLKP